MSIEETGLKWLWTIWLKKWVIKGVQALVAMLVVWLAGKGVPVGVLEKIGTVVDPQVIATAIGSFIFFVIDAIRSMKGFEKRNGG